MFFGFILALIGVTSITFCLIRTWTTVIILAFIELSWVCLCGVYGQLIYSTGDVYFLFWSCAMLFFSAVELTISAISFLMYTDYTETTLVDNNNCSDKTQPIVN